MIAYPPDWPPGCPPSSAPPASGEVFRIVYAPPAPEDFQTYAELGLAPAAPPCKRLSLSVFSTRVAACHQAGKYPRLGNHVARGTLHPGLGHLSPASNTGHQEWWAPARVDRRACFGDSQPCP